MDYFYPKGGLVIMPELPEVETIRRQLSEVLLGKVIKNVIVLRDKSFDGDPNSLTGRKIKEVSRKSKVLEIFFHEEKEMVIVHLKMTGQLQKLKNSKTQDKGNLLHERIVGGHPSPDWVNELPSKHTRVVWNFTDGSRLYFNDMRVFGWMKMVNRNEYEKEIRKTAPDITDKDFTADFLFNLLKRSRKAVKLVLLDQDRVGGLGNIYVNEALYLAGINPLRSADSLSDDEVKQLHSAAIKVINLGIRYGGASAADEKFVNISGLGGKYQDHFLVYQRAGEKCRRCGSLIEKMKVGGRGTFYCPKCQK
ncbi:MAG: Formamidopyrimidine-DNA glycosylase [Candidatus Collierbacteria bacterium GW2011_GWC2_44_30]|nr:MAG: Formamidopyrimidine-DNA glycosylase [Candidatus Collierbacteria bacterium GW2011_GWC2_44_30]